MMKTIYQWSPSRKGAAGRMRCTRHRIGKQAAGLMRLARRTMLDASVYDSARIYGFSRTTCAAAGAVPPANLLALGGAFLINNKKIPGASRVSYCS
jgi:hypothetical protein